MKLTRRPLYFWVLKRFRILQAVLVLIIVINLFFRVFPLEMQRKIINEAINLKMLDMLYLYCALYMGAVLVAGMLKYLTNTIQAIVGQKILIGMRQELYQHIMQLPLTFFHRTQAGTIISAMTSELNAIGTFLGGAIAVPVTSILTFIAFLGFMIYLNPLLGFLSMVIYPFELIVIPLLQKWYNRYNRKRVLTTRAMASLVNESVSGIHEVQGNASYILEQTKLERLIKRLYAIMVRLSVFKYGIKFSNNLFQSLGPFLLFLVGGYMAIHGNFTIGALVAFLSAYEKVYDPWKEVIEYYQTYQDARVRYKQIMDLFDLEPEFLLEAPAHSIKKLSGSIEAKNLLYRVNKDITLLNDISFTIDPGKHVALVGFSGSGKSTLSLLIGQLYKTTSGSLKIGGKEIETLNKLEIALNISSVAQHPFIFTGTVRDNLLYSCNTLYLNDLKDELPTREQIRTIIERVGLVSDIIRWGLMSIIPAKRVRPLINSFLQMRTIFRQELEDSYDNAIEFYHAEKFMQHCTMFVNIIFGSYGRSSSPESMVNDRTFRDFLKKNDLEGPLTELGLQIARSTVSFLADFQEDDFFFQGSPMNPEQFGHFKRLCHKTAQLPLDRLKDSERTSLLLLALNFTPGIHKITTISGNFENRIIEARKIFLREIGNVDLAACSNGAIQTEIGSTPDEATAHEDVEYTPFCTNLYLPNHSLLDNILFGTVIDQEQVRERMIAIVRDEFDHRGLLDDILEIGLDFHVGSKGDNLSGGQKQKIALVRAFLKESPVLILDEATASLDNSSQAKIQQYIETELKGKTTVVAVVHRLDMISGYDHIIVMKDGKIVESGDYRKLIAEKGVLYGLINDSR